MNAIKKTFAKKSGQLARNLSRVLTSGSGEQIYGRVVDAINPNALTELAKNKRIIVISSTNGKTTTTHLIANAFRSRYKYITTNALGANQRAGLIAALSELESNDRNTQNQFAILEVDERSLPGLFDEIRPELLVLGNLSRDQLDRFGEVSSISKSWRKMLGGSEIKIIANGNDPHIVFAIEQLPNEQKTFLDLKSNWHNDANTCPSCGELLSWDDESHFNCSACGFSTPLNQETFDKSLLEKISEILALPGSWNINNALLAKQACEAFEINDEDIYNSWKNLKEVSGRNATYKIDEERTVQLFLAKNPAGWNETLRYLSDQGPNSTIFAFNCNIADGKDPSWLYDVDFESTNLGDVSVFGERKTDMQLRLEIAGISSLECENLSDALAKTAFSKHTNIVASYTQFLDLSRKLPKLYELEYVK